MIGLPVDFAYNNTAYEEASRPELTVTASNSFTVSDLVVDVQNKKGAALTMYHVTLCGQEQIDVQFSWYLDLSDDGKMIQNIVENVDPSPLLAEATLAMQIYESGQTC